VAGMTLGTLVVEANLTSGALITAGMAVDCGRQVFAVPGRIDSPRSKGCHELIKKGAKLCESAEDVLSEFEYLFPPRSIDAGPAGAPTPTAVNLSDESRKVYETLESDPVHIDEIIWRTGLTCALVSVTLLSLEMKRLVKQLPGRLYVRS